MKHGHVAFTILLGFVSAIALVFASLLPAFAAQGNTTSANPQTITVTSPAASDTLVGSPGGAYKFYQVSYQGGNAPVLFTLNYQPAFGGGNTAFGFNLYGPNSVSYAGQVTGTSGSSATAQYTLVNGSAMTVLVQVYNYTAGGSINYTLTVSGLSGGSASTITAQNNSSPDQAAPVTTINASLGGSITGSSAGAFNYYTLHYPGGNSPMAISMNYHPPYSGTGNGVGFTLYRNVPTGPIFVATSSVSSQDVNGATTSATITGASAADYQLQVFNYWPGVTISYGITTTGLAGPAPAATGNTDAAHAIVLTSARPGATATLGGNRGGSYNYYLVSYPGNMSTLDVSVTYRGTVTSALSNWGFQVYQGSTLQATVTAANDGNGVFSATWSYQNQNPTTFGIQVFNFDPTTTANYVIYQVGAQ
jgi:hypothetical protein